MKNCVRRSIGKLELPKARSAPFLPRSTDTGGGSGGVRALLGDFLNKVTSAIQTVVSDVIFLGEVTARKFITLPASLLIGSNSLLQAYVHFTTTSGINGRTAFILDREYDSNGSKSIFSDFLGVEGEIDLLPFTGTRFTFPATSDSSGTASPGVFAYQTRTQFFIYTPLVNLSLIAHINEVEGTIVSTMSDFDSVLSAAQQLPDKDRLRLIDALWDSDPLFLLVVEFGT